MTKIIEEAEAAAPASVTGSSGESTDPRSSTEATSFSSSEQEPKSTDSPAIVTGKKDSELDPAVDLSHNLGSKSTSDSPTESKMPEKASGSLEGESSKTAEKSSESLERENPESEKELSESKESEEKPLVSPKEVVGSAPEKKKKTVRMDDTVNVSENPNGKSLASIKPSPSVGTRMESSESGSSPSISSDSHQINGNGEIAAMVEEAWEALEKSLVYFQGNPVGTLAAVDPSAEDLNYNQVFVRDFFPSGLACLMKYSKEPDMKNSKGAEIVKNFLLKTLHLQGSEKRIDNFMLGEGVMPASFKVTFDQRREKESLVADFGGSAIGRVAPVDSGFWWIILFWSYTKCTGDHALVETPEVQKGIKLILNLCLSDAFNTFPTLLCADGCSMIDRRMGIYGYPLEIQALFFFALRCAQFLLNPDVTGGKELIERIDKRITALSFHIQTYYWLDFTQLNNIYRYRTEEYSHTAVNKFNVIPDSIPEWVFDFMPLRWWIFNWQR
ncbi:hypothetical protein L1049_012710 [Liquidambar formosana]|uniref:Alkaline/neutral invertase n=1 Tax=Liquidambar formosana TaxID=63359 RepID=A0AAP0RLM8_LIQFO